MVTGISMESGSSVLPLCAARAALLVGGLSLSRRFETVTAFSSIDQALECVSVAQGIGSPYVSEVCRETPLVVNLLHLVLGLAPAAVPFLFYVGCFFLDFIF